MSQLLTGGGALCFVGAILVIGFIFLANAIRIVPEYQRLVVFRLGRSIGSKGPGIVFLIPVIDRAVKVDLREQVREVPHQTSITKDNAPISIDFLWYHKVLDPAESVLQVGNFEVAAAGIAATTLRAVIGGIPLDDVLSEREHINNMLRTRLDEVTERWGVKVTNVAEGEKQSAILKAEGQKQAAILDAEGAQQAQILRAQGFAQALDAIFNTAKGIDQKTMTLQYFETLKSIGTSPSTKYIFPMEFTSMLD